MWLCVPSGSGTDSSSGILPPFARGRCSVLPAIGPPFKWIVTIGDAVSAIPTRLRPNALSADTKEKLLREGPLRGVVTHPRGHLLVLHRRPKRSAGNGRCGRSGAARAIRVRTVR